MTARLQACPKCFDVAFATPLLKSFGKPDMSSSSLLSSSSCCLVMSKVQNILGDICEVCPLSSDAVEVKNGNVQLAAGCRSPQDLASQKAGREVSLLMSIKKEWGISRSFLEEQCLPAKRSSSHILQQVGTTSVGRYTKDAESFIQLKTVFCMLYPIDHVPISLWPITIGLG